MHSPETKALPIDEVMDDVLGAVGAAGACVLVAETGAGKTTRVPARLLDRHSEGAILVLEPRRIAARLAATRVASERGESVGGAVGYSVRFEDRRGPDTRLLYVTTGTIIQRLAGDPNLRGVRAVVFDELHERHLADDLVLAWVRRLRRTTRPDLQVVCMSATLDDIRSHSHVLTPGRRWIGR